MKALSANDVTDTVGHPVDGRDGCFLGVARNIRRDEGELCDEAGGSCLRKVIPSQAARGVGEGRASMRTIPTMLLTRREVPRRIPFPKRSPIQPQKVEVTTSTAPPAILYIRDFSEL